MASKGSPAAAGKITPAASLRKGAAAVKGSAPAARQLPGRKPPAEEQLSDYDRALRAAADRPPERYKLSGRYVEGQRIQHAAFGLGVVLQIVNLRVIDVIFRSGTRRLAMAR